VRPEHKLKLKWIMKTFGPMMDDVTEQLRMLHNEELCDRYRLAIIGGKVKVKLSLCLTEHHVVKAYAGVEL
jgi:hypothetical protein